MMTVPPVDECKPPGLVRALRLLSIKDAEQAAQILMKSIVTLLLHLLPAQNDPMIHAWYLL